MFKKVLLSGLAMTLTVPAMAEVVLDIPAEVDLLVVNGKESDKGGFFSKAGNITLPDGENQIVFRYTPSFRRGSERDQFNSDVIIAKFDVSDTELTFKFPQYSDAWDAEKFNRNPQWQLINSAKQSVDLTQDKLMYEGFQLGRDYVQEVNAYNVAAQPAAVAVATAPVVAATTATATTAVAANAVAANAVATTAQATPAVAATAVATPAPAAASSQGVSTAEEMLYFWYSKADEDAKKRFKAYVNAQ